MASLYSPARALILFLARGECRRCGHGRAAHQHHHRGRYCGWSACMCPRYRRWITDAAIPD